MKNNKIKSNALSLFNGMGFAAMACDELGLKFDNFYISEIDKYANKAAMALYPNSIQLGDVTKWREWDIDWSSIDLLLGGPPCQGFSFAGKQAGTKAIIDGEEVLVTDRETYLDMKEKGAEFLSQSHLFWEFVLCLDHIKLHNPNAKFMLENVKMKKELLEMITGAVGVDLVCINSALVSPQNRVRNYWTDVSKVEQPEDQGIKLIDILEPDIDPVFFHSKKAIEYMNRCVKGGRNHWDFKHHSDADSEKSACVTANHHKGVPYNTLILSDVALKRIARGKYSKPKLNPIKTGTLNTKNNSGQLSLDSGTTLVSSGGLDVGCIRRLSPRECFRLQSVPKRHIETLLNLGISNTQLYKMCGNGWELKTVVHVLKGFNNEY